MRISELLRLVFINLSQNKFKVILTSVGIVVGSATIMLVLAIGTGEKMEIAEQFKNLNAGAIDISYESNAMNFGGREGRGSSGGGMPSGGGGPSGGGMPSGGGRPSGGGFSGGGMPSGGGGFPGGGMPFGDFGGMMGRDDRTNTEKIILSTENMEDLEVFVPGIADTTISYTTNTEVEGGNLEEASSYTIAGIKSNYMSMSNLSITYGEFISDENDENKEKYCVLGYSVAKEIYDSAYEACESVLYIDSRPYIVKGVLDEMGSVAKLFLPTAMLMQNLQYQMQEPRWKLHQSQMIHYNFC